MYSSLLPTQREVQYQLVDWRLDIKVLRTRKTTGQVQVQFGYVRHLASSLALARRSHGLVGSLAIAFRWEPLREGVEGRRSGTS
jgi:hypothetical protein